MTQSKGIGRGMSSTGFKKGNPGGPGSIKAEEKLRPIIDFLTTKLGKDLPLPLIQRLAKSLNSKDEKIFLDSFKTISRLIPEPLREITTSPVVDQLIKKHMAPQTIDIDVIEDKSEFGGDKG